MYISVALQYMVSARLFLVFGKGLRPSVAPSPSHLVSKMKYVFEQVMVVDGTRRLRGDMIQKTLKAAEFLIKFIMKSRVLYEQ